MTTLLFDDYTSSEQMIPKWMREERYMYCDPVTKTTRVSFWGKFLRFFGK